VTADGDGILVNTSAAQAAASRLRDPEGVESLGWFGLNRDVVHYGVTGAVVGPGHQAVDVLGRALEDRFDPAVGQVADPSGHTMFLGEPPAGIAEEDTLDPAGDQDTVADHKQTVRWPGPGGSAGRRVSGLGWSAGRGVGGLGWSGGRD
jgi:hypothetical protein